MPIHNLKKTIFAISMKKLLNKLVLLGYGAFFNMASYFSREKTAKKAFLLFCTPRKGRVLPAQKLYLENAKDAIIEVKGIAIQTYRWQEEGATVLLLHGWESNSFRWRNLVPKLTEKGYNVVAMDAPAHGNSGNTTFNAPMYADCVQKIIEIHKPAYIIGHSLGGMTLIYNQYKYKNKGVEKMVALGAPSELADFMQQYQKILGLSKRLMGDLENYFVAHFQMRFADFSTPKFAKTLNVKGLLIHDELDLIAPMSCSEAVHASWKRSQFIKTKGLGHSLHQDKVRNQIIDFLNS